MLRENIGNAVTIGKKDLIILSIFLVISSVIIPRWFRDATLINMADFDFPISPVNDFLNSLFIWKQNNLGFTPVFRGPARSLLNFWIAVLYINGFSITFIEKMWFLFLNFLSGSSMYFLIKYFLCGKKFSLISSFVGANFYMFNTYLILVKWSNGYIVSLLAYAFLPLVLLCFMQYINTSEGKYLSFLGILSFFAIPSADNPAHYILIPMLIVIYGLYAALISKQKNLFVKLIFTILVLLSIDAVWLLPLFAYLWDGPHFPVSNLIDWNDLKVESASEFSEIFRFLGFWVLKGLARGEYYFPYWNIYYTSLFIFLGFGIFILSLLNLFVYKDKNQLFFTTLAIFSIFFMKGISPPLESVNACFYQNIPYFFAFRQSYEKFGALFVFSVAVLLGFSTQVILSGLDCIKNNIKFKRISLLCTSIVILLMINFYAWPFWTGDIFPEHDKASILKSARITEIPESYAKIAEMINSQPNIFRIIGLPGGTRLGWTPFTWGYIGPNPLYHYIVGKSFFIAPGGPWAYNQSSMDCYLLDLEHRGEFSKLANVSGYLNLKYIILDKSVDSRIYEWIINPEVINHELINTSNVEFVKSYNQLYLYKFPNKFFLPHIYSAVNPIVIEGNIDNMLEVMSSIPAGNYIFILSSEINEKQYKFLKSYTNTIFINKKIINIPICNSSEIPWVTFEQINPTKYVVKVENATWPFFLVLSESYNTEWKIYIKEDNQMELSKVICQYPNIKVKESEHKKYKFSFEDILFIFKKPAINEDYHFIVNGYANAWYIDPSFLSKTGNNKFTIIIYFRQQSYGYLGILISLIALLCCIGYLAMHAFKSRVKVFYKFLRTFRRKVCGRNELIT